MINFYKGEKMEKFYFERPSLKRKEEIIEYLDEFKKNNSNINGSGGLDKIYSGYKFEDALLRTLNMEDEEYAKSVGKCPGITFLLIRDSDNKIVGTINLRWNLNEEMLKFAGHIGYGIRPSERQKGYNEINLYMVLKEAKRLGLEKVMLGCGVYNIASNKTIKRLGGVLERTEVDPEDNILSNVYWINVSESLDNNKEIFEKYIK